MCANRSRNSRVGLQKPVLLAHEDHVLEAAGLGRGALFLLAHEHQFLMGDLRVVIALVPVGQDHVVDIDPGLGHQRGGAAARDVRVVRMRHDDQAGLDALPVNRLPFLFLFSHSLLPRVKKKPVRTPSVPTGSATRPPCRRHGAAQGIGHMSSAA